MKARVPTNNRKIILSIGMIVKNEENFLRDCLVALKPLMDQVRSELIIVDTGSTDKTIEIAKEFTDQVIPFEWCDDFAAARNCGLNRARGEWFMFIDADEHFVQVKGIADFLNGPYAKDFDVATYKLRNFFDKKHQTYADHPMRRLHKIYDGIKFEHSIHEGIMERPNAVIHSIPSKALAYHYGYSSEWGKKYREEKHKRNLNMLKDALEKAPEDAHMIVHMVKECVSFSETDDGIFYCLKGIELEKKVPNAAIRCFYYSRLITLYFAQKKVGKMLETITEYFERNEGPCTTDLDVYTNRALQYMQLSEFEKAKADYEKYLEYYQAYSEEKLITPDMYVDPIVTTQKDYYYRAISNYSICLTKVEEYDKAFAALQKIKPREIEIQNDTLCYMVSEFTLMEKTENYGRIGLLYDQIKEQNDEDKLKIVQRYIDGFIATNKEIRVDVSKILTDKFKNKEDNYIKLHKLRLAAADGNSGELHSLLRCFLGNTLNAAYSDVLYFAMREDFDLPLLAKVVDFENISEFFANIEQKYGESAQLICDYFASRETPETILELRFSVALKQQALADEELDKKVYTELFDSYCNDLILYVYNVVTPQMMDEENIKGLPKLYRFAYDMNMAKTYLQEKQAVNYVKSLKSALAQNESMTKPIKMLLDEFEAEMEEEEKQQAEQQKEFNAYALELKAKIKQMMKTGEYTAAGQIAQALQKLLPDDKELKKYQAAIKEKTK